jgi:hypothetical protein
MNTVKLSEALNELQSQRSVLDAAISNIQNVLAMLNGQQDNAKIPTPSMLSDASRSYIDDAVDALRNAGKPMHITKLAIAISELRGKEVSRASVESSFIRHIAKTKVSRLTKTARSTYGLPEWKQQPMLAQIAS